MYAARCACMVWAARTLVGCLYGCMYEVLCLCQQKGGFEKAVPLSAPYLLSGACVERHYRSPVDTDKAALTLNSSPSSSTHQYYATETIKVFNNE